MLSIYHSNKPKCCPPEFNWLENVEGFGGDNFPDHHPVRLSSGPGCVQEHGSQDNEVRGSLLYSHLPPMFQQGGLGGPGETFGNIPN